MPDEICIDILNISSECLKLATGEHGRYSVATGAASLLLNDFFKVPLVNTRRIVSI